MKPLPGFGNHVVYPDAGYNTTPQLGGGGANMNIPSGLLGSPPSAISQIQGLLGGGGALSQIRNQVQSMPRYPQGPRMPQGLGQFSQQAFNLAGPMPAPPRQLPNNPMAGGPAVPGIPGSGVYNNPQPTFEPRHPMQDQRYGDYTWEDLGDGIPGWSFRPSPQPPMPAQQQQPLMPYGHTGQMPQVTQAPPIAGLLQPQRQKYEWAGDLYGSGAYDENIG